MTRIVLQYKYCIAGWEVGRVVRLENCIAIQLLYCRQEKVGLEILYCNTPLYCDMSSLAVGENCIAIQGLGCWRFYIAIHQVYCDQGSLR